MNAYHLNDTIKSALLLEESGRIDEAIRLYEEAIQNSPHVEFYLNLAALWFSTGSHDRAAALLNTAIEIQPACTTAYLNLGSARYALRDPAGAFSAFRKAWELEPHNSECKTRFSKLLQIFGPRGNTRRLLKKPVPTSLLTTVVSTVQVEGDDNRNLCSQEPIRYLGDFEFCDGGRSHQQTKSRIAFVSPHSVLDFTNGAATTTLDSLKLFARCGYSCEAFCGTMADAPGRVRIKEMNGNHGEHYVSREADVGPFRGRMMFTSHGEVSITFVDTSPDQIRLLRKPHLEREEIAAFITACELFLASYRPNVVWTYGGNQLALVVQQLAKRQGIPIVFALHNFAYMDKAAFSMTDYVVVPTEFARQHYAEKLGLKTVVLPPALDVDRFQVPRGVGVLDVVGEASIADCTGLVPTTMQSRDPSFSPPTTLHAQRYLTFVNPTPRKGLFFFARIAETLLVRRPDIPLLVVEGSGIRASAKAMGIDFSALQNVRIMPNTPDARQFLAVTKLLLMPSLMDNAAMVAREAMFNAIPILASDRGGLPETIGDAGFLFNIPSRYTQDTRNLPLAEEVEPWIETIIRLWDDRLEYGRWSQAAQAHAQQWHPDHLAPIYREFFGRIMNQTAPPSVQ